MPDLTQIMTRIEEEGYSLDEINKSELTIAFLSLRLALRAWYSTYQCFRWRFYIADPNHTMPSPDDVEPSQFNKSFRQQNHPLQYFEAYSETILHFQHFFELILKDILKHEHELLVSDASHDPLILYKLLKGEGLESLERQKLRSVEFNETLTRVICLLDNSKIDQTKYGYIKEGKPILEKLNGLRNRLIHRGTFVLPYAALDEFIGKYLLPLVITTIQLLEFSGKEHFWLHQPLSCDVNPLFQLQLNFQAQPINFIKAAFLKELGRAAYLNPVQKQGLIIDNGDRERAEAIAKIELKQEKANIYDILCCPVCGCQSLIRFFDIETENPDPKDPGKAWLQTVNVQCYCCTFEITSEITNASQIGLPIEDYWMKE